MGESERDDIGSMPTLPETESRYGGELRPGTRAGDYIVESQRARGGFATVYLAHHERDAGQFALKVLHKVLVHRTGMIRRFQQEGEVIRRIDHPNVVRLIDYGDLPDGRPYFVMPWLEGRTLASELAERGVFSIGEASSIMAKLTEALEATHAVGIVHRDVKPSNVLLLPVDPGVAVRLVDFGVAKLVGNDDEGRHHGITSTGVRVGTPYYMAPEQISSRPIDSRTDIYALGVELFQMVTGHLPFTAPTAIEIEALHLHAPPPRASEVAGVPPAFDEVILRCMAKSPDNRFASVLALREALERAASPYPTEAASLGSFQPGVASRKYHALAIGIFFEARVSMPDGAGNADVADELFDSLDDALEQAEEQCAAHGFDIAMTTSASILAISPLPGDADSARQAREQALVLAEQLATCSPAPEIRIDVTVHVADVLVDEAQRGRTYVGGDLLRLADWTTNSTKPGVTVTDASVAGLEDQLDLAPIAGAPDFLRSLVRKDPASSE